MSKKIMILLLTAIMVIGFTPLRTYAAEITGDGYSFDPNSGTLTITSNSGTTNWSKGTGIKNDSVKKLVIENSVTAIEASAFWDCSKLIWVNIPDSIASIGDYAFESCSSLVSATFLRSTAPTLGTGVFSACKNGFRIYFPAEGTGYNELNYKNYKKYSAFISTPRYSFDSVTGTLTILSNGGTTSWRKDKGIEKSIIRSLVISEGVTSIGVTSGGEGAFEGCMSLQAVSLPNSLESLGKNVFSSTGLTEITIPNGVTAIPEWAFNGCPSLSSVTIPDSVTSIGDYAFGYSTLKELNLPQNLTSIGSNAFLGCMSLEIPAIPDGVTSIGDNAFKGCRSLAGITIPDGITSISDSAFSSCYSLTHITIPDGVTSIGDNAFSLCNLLTEITIPAGVTSIGKQAFYSCPLLASATFKGMSAPTFGTDVFLLCKSGFTIYYPAGGTGYDNLGVPAIPIKDTMPPAAPVILSPADGSTISTNLPAFAGKAEAGSTVTIYLDGISTGTATANASGSWSFTPAAALADGTHNIKATAMDAAGNVSADSNVITFTVDTTPPSRSITTQNDGHGTAGASATSAAKDTKITLTATPNAGYHFKEWQVISPIGLTITGNIFTMPDEAVTVKAIFEGNPLTDYTLIINGSYASMSGAGNYAEGVTVTINAGSRSNYTFSGWSTSDRVTFVNANSAATTFTMPAKNVIVTAVWSYNGGGSGSTGSGGWIHSMPIYNADVKAGNGSKTPIPVTVNKNTGSASIDVSSQGSLTTGESVITVPLIPNVGTYSVGIPVPYLSTPEKQGTLTINTNRGVLTIPSNMLTGVLGASGNKAEITIGQGDKSKLSADIKNAIGNKPLVSLSLFIDGRQTDWNNPNASVTVSIPYIPTAEELKRPEHINIWYIDGSGRAVSMNGRYDKSTGMVIFTTNHFSVYAVVYDPLARLTGANRIETALKIAQSAYPGKIKSAVLATAESFPDALAGSVLAYQLNAPILLTGSTETDQEKVIDYLKANLEHEGTIYILGGTAAVSSGIDEKIQNSGFHHITRIAGDTRYDTAVKIAEQLKVKTGTPVVLVNGDNYPDALAVSSIAAQNQFPIFLVQKDRIDEAVSKKIAAIKPDKIYIIGLQGVISSTVETQAARLTGLATGNIVRIGGADRYTTSIAVAEHFNLGSQSVCIATGNNFPDALAGSVYAAKYKAPIILTDKKLPEQIVDYIKSRKPAEIIIFGGDATVGKETEQLLRELAEVKIK